MPNITRLEIHNYGKIKALEITPKGSVVKLVGKNEQGKSTILRAIAEGFGGAKYAKEVPLRTGETNGELLMELGDLGLTVRKRWTKKSVQLEVTDASGVPLKRPQELLARLVGKRAIDPLAFLAPDKKRERLETMRAISGCDLTDVQAQRAAAYAKRTQVNRDFGMAEGRAASLKIDITGIPTAEVEIKDILEQQVELMKRREANDLVRRQASALGSEVSQAKLRVEHAKRKVVELERSLAAATAMLASAKSEAEMAQGALDAANEEVAGLVEPDFAEVERQLAGLHATNAKVRQVNAWKSAKAEAERIGKESEELTRTIAELDSEARRRIAQAKFPVPGLGFGDDDITIDDLPFTEASRAKQLRVATATAIADRPELKIILIDDGEKLDSDGMAIIHEMAEASGSTVWIAVVADEGKPGSILIVDGEVAEDRQ